MLIKLKYRQKRLPAFSLSDVVITMLINVKMATIVGILTLMSRINFVLSWVWAWKKFYNLRPGLWTHIYILLNNLLETQPNLIPSFSLIFKISSFILEHEQRFYNLGQTPRYNTLFMLNSTEHEISYKLECWKTEEISCFQTSNSKMMYKCIYHADSCHFNIYEYDKFHTQLSWAWKKICIYELVSIFRGIIFWRHDQTSSFPRPPVHSLYNINEFLHILHCPVNLIVVTRSQINHNVLISVEEHTSAWIIQFIHFIEVRHVWYVHQVDNGKVFHLLRTLVKGFVHHHAGWVPVVTESYNHGTILLREYGLIHLPSIV